MGEVVEMSPWVASASSTVTSLYSIFGGFDDVQHDNLGTVSSAVLGQIVQIQHGQVGHALVELAEAGGDVALALLGVLILGVFREIAVRARDFDLFRELVV